MLKSGFKTIIQILYEKPYRKARNDSYWTDVYPSPEPSLLRGSINKACNWVYRNIDHFFRGNFNQQRADLTSRPGHKEGFSAGCCQEWDLHQDVMDIAYKDVKGSLSWLVPDTVKQFVYRLNQRFLLYFYTDIIVGEDDSVSSLLQLGKDISLTKNSKHVFIPETIKAGVKSKLLSANDWWVKQLHTISLLIGSAFRKKTYYLLADFTPRGYDIPQNDRYHMIRGPDKIKLNPASFFHIRI
jgi:hypothetical protein